MTGALTLPDRLGDVLSTWLSGRSPRTVKLYSQEIERYAQYAEHPTGRAAVEELLSCDSGRANMLVRAYRGACVDAGQSSRYVNLHLATLRSVVSIARQAGLVTWSLDVPGVKVDSTGDMHGPPWGALARMIDAEPSLRNRAILALMGHRGLRCAEVLALTLADVGPGAATVDVVGKGRREKETLTLAPMTAKILAAHTDGREPGPLFDLEPDAVRCLVRAAGKRVDVKAWPHSLRHCAITRAVKAMRGDVAAVQAFARHADVRTTLLYVKVEADTASKVAFRMTGDEWPEEDVS